MNAKNKIKRTIELPIDRDYIARTFKKMNIPFKKKRKILDVGCGSGNYSKVFIELYGVNTYGIDIYEHEDIKKIKKLKFKIGSIYDIKFRNEYFDYVFLHDVLHHIDEEKQSYINHIKAINELKRVTKYGGKIIIVEANKYNPLFYSHMELMRGHNHWSQTYFTKIMKNAFSEDEYSLEFKHFEAHVYPWGNRIWKIYEKIMEILPIKLFHAYNFCIATKIETAD